MPKKMVFNLKLKNKITVLIKEWKLNQVKQKMQTENITLIYLLLYERKRF